MHQAGLWRTVPTETEVAEREQSESHKAHLAEALNPDAILRAWSRIRPNLLKLRPKDTRLVHEPLDNLAFEVHRKANARALHQRIVSGHYVIRPPATVRAAKRNRLTRLLVYPSIEDSLVLTALCQAIQPSLAANTPPWVSFGERTHQRWTDGDYQDWFLQFLRHRSRSDRVAQNADELVISTDIANFFPTVNLDLLRDKVQAVSSLHAYGVNLLFRLLRGLGSSDSYDPFALHGLPQEPDDNSRLLASFYLSDLDHSLNDIGIAQRYSRFVDDIVLSATGELEASRRVAQLQRELERLGLAVNSSKTRIQQKDRFREAHFPEENEYLDLVGSPLFIELTDPTFDSRCSEFASRAPSGSWIQVMKRYYSAARLLEKPILIPYVWDHLRRYPELASSILDYLQVVGPTTEMAAQLFELIRTDGSVFDDIQIRTYETLLHAPFRNVPDTRALIASSALDHLHGKCGYKTPSGYVGSLCVLTAYKFGGPVDREELATLADRDDLEIEIARQLYVILRSEPEYHGLAASLPPRFDDPDLWRLVSLYNLIDTDPARVLKAGTNWLSAKRTTGPTRYLFRTRMLPVFQSLSRNPAARNETEKMIQRVLQTLNSGSRPKYIDQVAVARLQEICDDSFHAATTGTSRQVAGSR